MKTLLLTVISLLSISAFAKQPTLCLALLAENGVKILNSSDLLKLKTLSTKNLALLNTHLKEISYSDRDLSLSEAQALFSKGGEFEFDSLSIALIYVTQTNQKLVLTESYPGDNQYAYYFEAKSGKTVAVLEDGSLSVFINGKKVYCD